MNHLFLRRGELISILIALIMLLAIGIFSSVDWYEYRHNRDEVLASRLIFEHTNTLLLAITDAETSQRGFLLTGDAAYLDLYDSASRKIPQELDILDRATAGHEYVHERVRQLRVLSTAKLAETNQTIELRKRNEMERSMAIVATGRGKALMDSIRHAAWEIHTQETGTINGRSIIVRAHSDRYHFVAICSSAALLVLLGLGAITISRATERREQLIADLDKERKQTAEVRDLLQTTLSSIGDAVLVTDRRGRVTFLNRIAESLTGWRGEDAQGKPSEEVFHIVHEATRARAESPVARVLAEGSVVDFALRKLIRRDGSEIPVDDGGAPIRTLSGEILGVVLVFRDVTSRRASERERERLLAEAERSRADAEQQRSHLHSLFLQAPAMINIHRGPNHIFELVHPLTTELLGGRDVAGRPAAEVVPEHEYLRLLDEVFESGRPAALHEMLVRRSSWEGLARDVFLNCVFCPWREPEGTVAGVMTLAIDITGQVRGRQAMEATQERLRETAKLESLGVLAGGIAHDFNNLLVGIMGNASLALDTLPHSAPSRGMIESTIRASEKAAALVRQMLAYSGKGRFVITRVNFSGLVEEMLPLIRSSMPGTVAIRTHLAGDLPSVEGDSSQLQQVFMNLAINGAEACDVDSGTVTITTSTRDVDAHHIRSAFGLPPLQPGSYVCLEVADDGCGMDEATVARIFDPFFTTKFTGRGLGLSAVLGIIRAHKGAIGVHSTPGRGSTFRILFPAAPGEAKLPPPDLPKRGATRGTGTILVVDDEEMVRSMARATLEHYGYRVVEAANGQTAVGIFQERADDIDAVILDLTMPAMNGESALSQLKRINPAVPVVLSSGYNEAEATRRFHGERLAGFLQKPYTALALAERVRLMLNGKKNGSG